MWFWHRNWSHDLICSAPNPFWVPNDPKLLCDFGQENDHTIVKAPPLIHSGYLVTRNYLMWFWNRNWSHDLIGSADNPFWVPIDPLLPCVISDHSWYLVIQNYWMWFQPRMDGCLDTRTTKVKFLFPDSFFKSQNCGLQQYVMSRKTLLLFMQQVVLALHSPPFKEGVRYSTIHTQIPCHSSCYSALIELSWACFLTGPDSKDLV